MIIGMELTRGFEKAISARNILESAIWIIWWQIKSGKTSLLIVNSKLIEIKMPGLCKQDLDATNSKLVVINTRFLYETIQDFVKEGCWKTLLQPQSSFIGESQATTSPMDP